MPRFRTYYTSPPTRATPSGCGDRAAKGLVLCSRLRGKGGGAEKKRERLSELHSQFYLCSDLCLSPNSTVCNSVSIAGAIAYRAVSMWKQHEPMMGLDCFISKVTASLASSGGGGVETGMLDRRCRHGRDAAHCNVPCHLSCFAEDIRASPLPRVVRGWAPTGNPLSRQPSLVTHGC